MTATMEREDRAAAVRQCLPEHEARIIEAYRKLTDESDRLNLVAYTEECVASTQRAQRGEQFGSNPRTMPVSPREFSLIGEIRRLPQRVQEKLFDSAAWLYESYTEFRDGTEAEALDDDDDDDDDPDEDDDFADAEKEVAEIMAFDERVYSVCIRRRSETDPCEIIAETDVSVTPKGLVSLVKEVHQTMVSHHGE